MEWIDFTKPLPTIVYYDNHALFLPADLLDSWEKHFNSKGIQTRRIERIVGRGERKEILQVAKC